MVITIKDENNRFGARVSGIIYNKDKTKIFMQRQGNRDFYMFPGGRIELHEDSHSAIKRELKEEIGISVDDNDLILLKTNTEKGNVNVFRDVYVINKDIQINHLEFIDSEVSDAKYVTFEEFKNMIDIGEKRKIRCKTFYS